MTTVREHRQLHSDVSVARTSRHHEKRPTTAIGRSLARQRGVVLLLIVLALLSVAGVVFLAGVGKGSSERAQIRAVEGAQLLAAAKQALIGNAIGNLGGTGARPGHLPLPDTLANGNYDGSAETASCLDGTATNGLPALVGVAAQVANLRCLGRLPWKSLGLSIDGASERDPLGLMPWYAVSPNLADPNPLSTCMTVLNPTTAAGPVAPFSCGGVTTGPAWPWLKVCDSTGRLLSDRVAIVLILPGEAITTTGRTQARSITATGPNPSGYGNASDFLDAIPTPAGWAALPVAQRCSAFDNAGLTGEFIAAEKSSVMNDQVAYITIDELMAEVEKRVALEVREAIAKYRTDTNGYPWLANLTNPTVVNTSTLAAPGTLSGLVPFATPPGVTSQKFLTELSWVINTITGADTYALPATSSPTFWCYGGAYQCRLRTTTATAVPRTITTAEFTALKSSSIATPTSSCSYTFDTAPKTTNCDLATFNQLRTVSYRVERRSCPTPFVALFCSAYANVANFSGTQTRVVTAAFTVTGTPGSPLPASPIATARRTVTSAGGTALSGLLSVADSWTPAGGGATPFDLSSGPFLPWTASSAGTGTFALTTRLLPELPAWYLTQKWHEVIYAAISSDSTPSSGASSNCSSNCFSAGVRTGLDVVVISAGPPLPGKNRYVATPVATDFLEAPNATGTATRVFASSTANRSATYKDTVVTLPR